MKVTIENLQTDLPIEEITDKFKALAHDLKKHMTIVTVKVENDEPDADTPS